MGRAITRMAITSDRLEDVVGQDDDERGSEPPPGHPPAVGRVHEQGGGGEHAVAMGQRGSAAVGSLMEREPPSGEAPSSITPNG